MQEFCSKFKLGLSIQFSALYHPPIEHPVSGLCSTNLRLTPDRIAVREEKNKSRKIVPHQMFYVSGGMVAVKISMRINDFRQPSNDDC